MKKLDFSTIELIKTAWGILKKNWRTLLLLWGVIIAIQFVVQGMAGVVKEAGGFVSALFAIGSQVLSIILSAGAIKLELDIVSGKSIKIESLFSEGKTHAVKYFLTSLVVGLITMVGYFLLIIPGIIWSLKYLFAIYAAIDEGLDVKSALSRSAQLTDGIKWKLMGLSFALLVFNLLGLLVLVVGVVVTSSITGLVYPVLYFSLKKQLAPETASTQPAVEGEVVPPVTI